MLPADERTHPSGGSVHGAETLDVSLAPDEALRVGRHQFAVMVEQPSIRSDCDKRVVKGAPTGSLTDPLA